MSQWLRRGGLRMLAVAALVAVTALGAAARPSVSSVRTGLHLDGPVSAVSAVLLGLGAVAVVAALAVPIVEAIRNRKKLSFAPRRHPLAMLAAFVLVAGAILLIARFGRRGGHTLQPRTPPVTVGTPPPKPPASHGADGQIFLTSLWITLALLVVAGVAAAVWLRLRRRDEPAPLEPPPPPGDGLLPEAVTRRAREALDSIADPRQAVLTCWTALEEDLSDRGFEARPGDTAAGVLNGAGRSGIRLPASAARLAELFRLARYSSHPITEAHREEARTALDAATARAEAAV